MKRRIFTLLITILLMTCSSLFTTVSAQEKKAPIIDRGGETTSSVSQSAPPRKQEERDTIFGDWNGVRTRMKEQGIILKPRLTLFYQGMTSGEGEHNFELGGKADIMLNADLNKFCLWKGLSLNVHAELNFGKNVNGRGGTLAPVNTALLFPGMEGPDAHDLSSCYFGQTFGKSVSLAIGKINVIDMAAGKPFMGGAGIDSFWNISFAAPPSGTVPPYLYGAMLSMKTKGPAYGLWIYDPNSVVNKSCFEKPFADGITFRGSVDFPVTISGRSGHQGLIALYSNKNGKDLEGLGDIFLPMPLKGTPGIKNDRWYFAYTFDQYLYQSQKNPKEGVGLFGQFGISDGNPNRLHWSAFAGIGGTGLIPGRSRDNWGLGCYYDVPSPYLKDSLAPKLTIKNEQGLEIFYNYEVSPGLVMGADLQIINPSMGNQTAVFPGLRTVLKF